mgnify:CR=1 FL=1
MSTHKEITMGLKSLNEGGNGFRINVTMHPTMPGFCDFDINYVFHSEETDEGVGVLFTHEDVQQLINLLQNVNQEMYNRRLVEDDDNLEFDFEGDDD